MTTPDVAAVLIERQILLDRLEAEVEESLDQEIEEIKTLARGQNPDTGRPFGNDVAALFDTFLGDNVLAEGEALFTFVGGRSYRSTNKPPARLDQDPELVAQLASVNRLVEEQIDTPAGSVRYHAIPRPLEGQRRGVFVVANFLAQERAEVDLAVRVSGLAALAALLAAVGLAWVLAGRLLAPLRLLTDTARTITETDLTGRIPVRGRDEIAELTRTFNAMLDRLEDAFATQRAFLDDAGHELRTPITIIRGHLEVSGDDPEEREAATAVVMDELDRMARGVDDLLVLARAERPGFLETEPIDLAAFTSELHAKASALAPRTWELDGVARATVLGDRQRLTQAVMNLARNAVQHTSESDTIGVGSALAGGEARIWIRDTGEGIDPAEHEQIFERFARGTSVRGRAEGAGLGLAITRVIVEAHGGRIELDSRPGAGARFSVVVPAGSPARRSRPAGASAQPPNGTRRS